MKTNEIREEEKSSKPESHKDILPIFWDLASTDEGKRTERVADLISVLKSKAERISENDGGETSKDLQYTVKRLVKGIGSSRKCARQGFGTALAEVLRNFDSVKTKFIYKLMGKHLSVKGSFKSQEERDAFFGQTLCLAAMIQTQTPSMDNYEDYLGETVKYLMELMEKKSYLLEISTKLVIDILDKIDESAFTSLVFPVLGRPLKGSWAKCTPEKLALLLAIERNFKRAAEEFFNTNLNQSNVIMKENMEKFGKILMDSTVNAHPRMHLVWEEVFPHILKSNEVLQSFWETVVEGQLMHSSHERKFLVFNILEAILARVTESQVEIVISERLMKSIINGSVSEKNYLYTASRKLLTAIPSQASSNSNTGVSLALIYQIIRRSGSLFFDSMTKSKAIESLIGKLDPPSVTRFISWLKHIFIHGKVDKLESSENEIDIDTQSQNRKWAISQLLTLVRSATLAKDEAWLLDVVKFLFLHSHFHVIKAKTNNAELYSVIDPPLEDAVVGLCKERFLATLAEVSAVHSMKDTSSAKHNVNAIPGTLMDGDFYAFHLVQFSQELLKDHKHIALNKEWTPDSKETFDEAMEIIKGIREKVSRESPMSEDRAFELLFLHSCLQIFDKTQEAADVVQELIQCFKKLKEKKKKKKASDEPHWSEVLTEILLSFLAQSSHMMRQIVNLAFTMMLPHITNDAFQLIMEALRPKKNAGEAGLELINESDEEMEADVVEEKSDDDDSGDEDDKEEDSSDDDSEDEASNDDIDEAFRTEVKSALGDAAAEEEDDSEASEDEDSDIDMDSVDQKVLDSMDKALAAAFKTRMQSRTGKKKKEDEKKTIVHFRLRVLDIAERIVKKDPKSPLILEMIEPLLEVIKVSSMLKEEKELHDRAQGILKNKIFHAREIPNGEDVNKDEIHEKIEELMKLARNASSGQMVNVITSSCMYLIRVLRGKEDIKEPSPLKTRKQRQKVKETPDNEALNVHGSLDCERIVRIFTAALEDFMTRRASHLQPIVFLEFIKRYPSIAWQLSSALANYISNAVNNFRKIQACEMIFQLLVRVSECAPDQFEEMSKHLQQQVIEVFKETCHEKCTMKAKHLHEVAKLLDKFVKENKKTFKLELDEELVNILEEAIKGPIVSRSNQLVAYCRRIISSLSEDTENVVKTKRKRLKKTVSSKEHVNGEAKTIDNEDKDSNKNDCEPSNKKKKRNKSKQ